MNQPPTLRGILALHPQGIPSSVPAGGLKMLGVLALLLLLACNPTDSLAASDCADLITGRCETCHYKTRICDALGKKSRWRWKGTIKNMVRKGAILSKDEQNTLLACLSSSDASVLRLCFPEPPLSKPSR